MIVFCLLWYNRRAFPPQPDYDTVTKLLYTHKFVSILDGLCTLYYTYNQDISIQLSTKHLYLARGIHRHEHKMKEMGNQNGNKRKMGKWEQNERMGIWLPRKKSIEKSHIKINIKLLDDG